MRIAIAALACLIAPVAFAQDKTPQQLQEEHYAALAERYKNADAANAAVAAKDWRLACIRSKDAISQNDKAVGRLSELRDAIGSQIEPAMLEIMSKTIMQLHIEGSQMRTSSDGVCAQANKQS